MYYTVKYAPMFGESERFLVKAPDAYEALKKVCEALEGRAHDGDPIIDLKFLHIEKWTDEVVEG